MLPTQISGTAARRPPTLSKLTLAFRSLTLSLAL